MKPTRQSASVAIATWVLLMAGCAAVQRTPPSQAPHDSAPAAQTAVVQSAKLRPVPPPAEPQASAAPVVPVVPVVPVSPIAPANSSSPAPIVAQLAVPAAKPALKSSPAPAPTAPPAKAATTTATAPVAEAAALPALDLKSLEARLKETKAIGVFTKLTVKNQVDELLDRFRAFYSGRLKTSLAELRRSYDLLVLKVLALLQDADPPLATAIAASRESIWGILSNPVKFSTV